MTAERWAQQIIEKELNCPVVVHDDGSQPSMYDLRIGAAGAPEVAIECVRAVGVRYREFEGGHVVPPEIGHRAVRWFVA